MTFGLTPFGWNPKRLADIVTDLENSAVANFGDINLDPQSVFGQIIGSTAKNYADIWDNLAAIYYSQYPNSAEGISLDNVVQLNGISRLPATQTTVYGVLTGSEGTLIPQGSVASIPSQSQNFATLLPGIITASLAYSILSSVTLVTTAAYTAQINGQNFIYSLPIITFTGSFVTSNVIVVTINGVQGSPINFLTDSDTTLGLIATQIASNAAVDAATPSSGTTITIVPNAGYQVVINSIEITGGVSQPTYAITYATPSNSDEIVNGLLAIINKTPLQQPVTASYVSGNLLVISNTVSIPFSMTVGSNMSVISQSTAIQFASIEYGPIPCPTNALDNIVTSIFGWNSITNPVAGITGTATETDAALRIRRQLSIAINGNATVEAIRAKLLALPGVNTAIVIENSTITQAPIIITLSGPLIMDNTIVVTVSGVTLPTVTYATSNVATMDQIALLIAGQPGIVSAVVSGSGNNIITVSMDPLYETVIDPMTGFVIEGGDSQAIVTISGGQPAKSFQAIVQGGQPAEIGEAIWLSKPAGIQTFGNTSYTITDSQGDEQIIYYSVPVPVYIWVEVTLSANSQEEFPVDGDQLVQQAILDYIIGNANLGLLPLGIGVDVFLQRVNAQIFKVPGIASGDMQIAFTSSPNITPDFGTSDITINITQISTSSLSMITVTGP